MIRFIKIYAFIAFCEIILMSVDAHAVSRRYLQEKCNELKRQDTPKISVVYNYGILKYDFGLTSDEIEALFNKTRNEKKSSVKKVEINDLFGGIGCAKGNYKRSASGTKTYGLTVQSSYNNIQLQIINAEISSGYYCVYPAEIEIFTGFNSPTTIYISKDLDKTSCRYRKTLLHEYHHVDVAYIAMNAYLNALKSRLPEILANMKGAVVSEGKQADFSSYYKKIDSLYQFYIHKWNEESFKIDTDENYQKEAEICK